MRQPLTVESLAPPAGSTIRVRESSRSLTLKWPPRTSSDDDSPKVVLLGLWLVCWTAVEALFLFGFDGNVFIGLNASLLEMCWSVFVRLCFLAWTIGGLYGLVEIAKAVFRPNLECLVLTEEHLRYVPSRSLSVAQLLRVRFHANATTRLRWHQLSALRLAETEGRQRLLIVRSVDQIEIGANLGNSEREWLLDVIWKCANRAGYR